MERGKEDSVASEDKTHYGILPTVGNSDVQGRGTEDYVRTLGEYQGKIMYEE